ncbi:hypothetical protein Tco_0099958 [Tanacetum coccineum]
MGIRHAKTHTLREEVFDETRAKVLLSQNPRSPSLPKLSRQGRDRGIQFLESSLKSWDTPTITGYLRLGNPAITSKNSSIPIEA